MEPFNIPPSLVNIKRNSSNEDQPSPPHQLLQKKKKLGRQARKRRKKALAIEEAAAAAALSVTAATSPLDGREEATTKSGVVPNDRSYVLDAVRQKSELSKLDCQHLLGQLGYLPGNALCVAARVKDMFTRNSNSIDDTSRLIPEPNDTVNNETTDISRRLEALKKDQTMSAAAWDDLMEQPLVLKVYPLAIREESDSTRSRRKRKRQQQNDTGDTKTLGKDEDDDDEATSSTQLAERPSSSQPCTNNQSNTSDNKLMEPFPTIYWVTHPYVKALISKLELERLGSVYEKCLKKSLDTEAEDGGEGGSGNDAHHQFDPPSSSFPSLSPLDYMKRAHRSYGKERYEMLTAEDLQWIKSKNKSWTEAFNPTTRGVAGIRNPAGVKCLHAHAGHYWSGCNDNIVGRWVADRVVGMWLSNLENKNRIPTNNTQAAGEQEK